MPSRVDLNGLSDPIIGLLVTLQSVEEVAYKIEQKRLCSRRISGIKRLKAEEEERTLSEIVRA